MDGDEAAMRPPAIQVLGIGLTNDASPLPSRPMAVAAPTALAESTLSLAEKAVGLAAWEDIVAPVRGFLGRVNEQLAAQVSAFEPELAEYARYALDSQGKQIRPVLVALAAGCTGPQNDEVVTIAVIIEMVHLATLVHDDIMDGAALRRGRATLAAKWGNEVSVLLGDCLFAQALSLACNFKDTSVPRAVAKATQIVCTGEILQTQRRRKWQLPRQEYFRLLEMKTAELFALACEQGCHLTGGSPGQAGALRRYGLALGTAYQVYDDVLDLYGAENKAGKSLGTDLAKGKPTLPLLHVLETAPASDRAILLGWLADWDPSHFAEVRQLLESHGAIRECRRVIDGLLDDARRALDDLPPTPERLALDRFTAFLSQQTATLVV